ELFASSSLNLSGQLSTAAEIEYERLMRSRYVSTYIDDLLFADDSIEAVLFMDTEGRQYITERRQHLKTLEKLPVEFPYQEVREARGRAIWVPGNDPNMIFMGK